MTNQKLKRKGHRRVRRGGLLAKLVAWTCSADRCVTNVSTRNIRRNWKICCCEVGGACAILDSLGHDISPTLPQPVKGCGRMVIPADKKSKSNPFPAILHTAALPRRKTGEAFTGVQVRPPPGSKAYTLLRKSNSRVEKPDGHPEMLNG